MKNLDSKLQGFESLNRMKLMMNYNSAQTLNENESRLLETINKNDFVFIDLLSPDKKYAVFFDELIDLENKKHLGSLWESVDNFRLFFENTIYNSQDIPKTIKESLKEGWKELIITESIKNKDLTILKEGCRIIFSESEGGGWSVGGTLKDFGSWFGKKATDLATSTGKMISGAAKGAYDVGKAALSGDIMKVLKLLGQGAVYFARWLRGFMYNPVGIIIDTVLLALGIGKTVQWIPWAIIVALDVYEVTTGDYEDKDLPLWMRVLFIGMDILGLVVGAAAAKAAKMAANPLLALKGKSAVEIGQILAKNPTLYQTIMNMEKNVAKVPGFLQKAVDLIKPRFPKLAEWLAKMASSANSFVQKFVESLRKIFTKSTAKMAVKKGLPLAGAFYGVEKGIEKGVEWYQGGNAQQQIVGLDQEQTDALNQAFDS